MRTFDSAFSTQINNGLRQTCADGAALAFDTKYGIMFCAYMPGFHGDYGESRGKIALSCFPASQPTNIQFVDIVAGNDVYVPNILSLGNGCVRVFYEKNSRADGDHPICYKDYDFINDTLSEEMTVLLAKADGTAVPLGLSECFAHLEANGYFDHKYVRTEQIIFGGCTLFRGDDGYTYGALSGESSETILYRSKDDVATVEFFAIYPRVAEYEFDYKILNGTIYALHRTHQKTNGNTFAYSEDGGKTWSDPVDMETSIQCRPRVIISNGKVILGYNYLNQDSGNRPNVIMGRTAIKICTVEDKQVKILGQMHSKYGIVNIALVDVLGDVYMAYSTSESALEYQNGTPWVRGKDAIRYIKLGDLFAPEG